MQKWMCFSGIGVGVLTFVVGTLDLVTGIPFSKSGFGEFMLYDIGGILAGGTLAYLGFNAYQDVK